MLQKKTSVGTRVLILLENNLYSIDQRVQKEARALVAAGYVVTVICPRESSQPWREMIEGVLVYGFPAPPVARGVLGYLWEYTYSLVMTFLISLVASFQPGFDFVHAANPPDTLVLIGLFYKLFGKHFVFDHHDLSPELYLALFGKRSHHLLYRLLLFFERLSVQIADHVIATNQSYKTIEMRRDHMPEGRITIVRNGPDLNRLRPRNPDPNLRQAGKTLILYVGEIGFQDGVDYLLRALHYLADDLHRDDFYCRIVGSGDAITDLKSLAAQLGLTNYVSFAGWVGLEDVARYLSSADICVAPEPSNFYNDHSTMNKIMEYMAFAKPIVAFDLPEHRTSALGAAVYAYANDEMDFARQIAVLMDDQNRRKTMGELGRTRVELDLAWEHQRKNLIYAYTLLTNHISKKRRS